jgi:predicted ATPase
MYIIGKTGMGKSTLIENMAAQDIINGNGLCFFDPHGSAVEFLLNYIPKERVKDVIYFTPFDTENPLAFNIMEDVGEAKRHLVAQGIISSMKKIFGEDTFSDRMEHILNNVILALLEYPNTTLLSMTRILTDNNYKKKVVDNIQDPSVKGF